MALANLVSELPTFPSKQRLTEDGVPNDVNTTHSQESLLDFIGMCSNV